MDLNSFYVFSKRFNSIDDSVFKYIETNINNLKKRMYSKNTSDIIEILDKVGSVFADKNSSYYKIAFKDLTENVKFSKPMIKETLDIIPQILSKKNLQKRLSLELVYPTAINMPIDRYNYDGYLKAYPRGVVFHVGAGNVFIGILDSLINGIITKNINIVKVSSKGSNFMNIFSYVVKEIDRKSVIADSFAILKWKGGEEKDIERKILSFSDLVVVWGGYDVAEYYKKNIPFSIDVEIFGPKTSFGILFEDYLIKIGYKETARRIVKDCAMWDQGACSNMHDLYIICDEKKRDTIVKNLIEEIEIAFKEFEKKLPCGRIDPDEMVEILKARELAKVDSSFSNSKLVFWKDKYTVIYEKNPLYRISPLNRTLYIKTVKSIDEVKKFIFPYKHYLQTLGIGGNIEQKKMIVNLFFDTGVVRFCEIGKMTQGVDGSPHDGRFVLSRFVKWVGLEGKSSCEEKLIELVNYAKSKSSFYSKFCKKKKINSIEDFTKLPILTKEHLLKNTPPKNLSLFTSLSLKGIYFASGGSTGHPKYVFYDQKEYEHVIRMLAYAYEAGGIRKGDVVANLFVSGNLWSSALSVERALSLLDVISVPIGSSLPVENIIKYLDEFNVNVIIGLPSFLIKLTEYVKNKNLKININKIFYGGEYVTDEMIKFWKDVFGKNVLIKSGGYASADAGVIGFQCSYLEKGFHHLFNNSQYLEIVDSETLKPTKIGEIGEVLITPLGKRKMPLIRYRIGDLARWLDFKCKCGRNEPIFEIVGRCDDRIHAGGAHIFVWDIQKAISSIEGLSFNFQVIIDKKGAKDILEIIIESENWKESKNIIPKLEQKIFENCQDLFESIRMGWIDKPKISIVPPDTIERIKRTGKIKRVVDKRLKI